MPIKLIDAPELGYFINNHEPGDNIPKGEILMRGPCVTRGYFKMPEKTKELLDKEGWVHSGDIGGIDKNGNIFVIDRIQNMFRLSNDFFIIPEPLEKKLMSSLFVQRICICGSGYFDKIVAIVVPNVIIHDIARSEEDKQNLILEDLHRIAKTSNFQPNEYPTGVIIASEPFTKANGMLTHSKKLIRKNINKYYENQIQELLSK